MAKRIIRARRPFLAIVILVGHLLLLAVYSIDLHAYSTSLDIAGEAAAGSTGQLVIDKYDFVVDSVSLTDPLGATASTVVGGLRLQVHVVSPAYSGLHTVRIIIYSDSIQQDSHIWAGVSVGVTPQSISYSLPNGFPQGSEVIISIAVEEE